MKHIEWERGPGRPTSLRVGRLTVMFGCAWGCFWPLTSMQEQWHDRLGHWNWTYYDSPWHMKGDWFLELGPVNLTWWAAR